MYDVIIVGGGPAGLSAGLVLARARRKVVICDAGQPRNRASRRLSGFISRDGIDPQQLLRLGREEFLGYGGEFRQVTVVAGECRSGEKTDSRTRFQITLGDNDRLLTRKLLLATGLHDVVPAIEGVAELYGVSVHHCPYCDGWEHRDQRLAAYGSSVAAVGLALALRTWSDRVTACTDGAAVGERDRERLHRNGIALREERVRRLEGSDRCLERIHFASGPPLACDAMFFNTGEVQQSDLPAMLGCSYATTGKFSTMERQRTSVSGLYLAGDVDGDVQFAIVAAAEGATAAVAINRELQDEDCDEPVAL